MAIFKRLKILILTLFHLPFLFGQVPNYKFLNRDLFPNKYFIENNGQFKPIRPSISEEIAIPKYIFSSETCEVAILDKGFAITNGVDKFYQYFIGINKNPLILKEIKSSFYHTYGMASSKSYGYQKLTFQNIYPNIDLIYEINGDSIGFKYSFKIHQGGDINHIKWRFGNQYEQNTECSQDLVTTSRSLITKQNNWFVYNELGQTIPYSIIEKNKTYHLEISVIALSNEITIDPWVTTINNMDTLSRPSWVSKSDPIIFRNCGINLQYDNKENVYVYGGSANYGWYVSGNSTKIAKYNGKSGALIWLFEGNIDSINWHMNEASMGAYTNFMVEPIHNNVYIGQHRGDFNFKTGKQLKPRIISLDSNGFYRGYVKEFPLPIHTFNQMHCDCINSRFFAVGLNSIIAEINDTGIVNTNFIYSNNSQHHEIHSAALDPTGNLFTLTQFNVNPSVSSINDSLFSISSKLNNYNWIASPNVHFLTTQNDRKYQANPLITPVIKNINSVAANQTHVFTFDGKNVQAYDKKTGKTINTFTFKNDTITLQGGIAADYSGHIFLGNYRPKISVLTFQGDSFKKENDLIPDSSILNSIGRIQDVKYNIQKNIIYATGDHFVTAMKNPFVNIDSTLFFYTNGPKSCDNFLSVKLTQPDSFSRYSFLWIDSNNQKVVQLSDTINHFSDTLKNPKPGVIYSVKIQRNFHCNGAFTKTSLSILPKSNSNIIIERCELDTWRYNQFTVFSDSIFSDTLKNQFQCDSIIFYQIKFKKISRLTNNISICLGDSIKIGQHTYKSSGNYHDTFSNYLGCDSIVTTHILTVSDTTIYYKFNLCKGDSVFINKKVYQSSGLFRDTLIRKNGCDSFIIINIKTLTDTIIKQSFRICSGDSIFISNKWNKTNSSGLDTFIRKNGCDSIITWNLIVNPKTNSLSNQIICNTDSIVKNGKKYKLPVIFIDTLPNQYGCDSLVINQITSKIVKANFQIDSTFSPEFSFKNLSIGNTQNYWNFGDNSFSNNANPIHKFNQAFIWKSWNICLQIKDSLGCSDTYCIFLKIRPFNKIIIPEGFSPNGDGDNDQFSITGIEIYPEATWYIFNIWGQLVFKGNSSNQSNWDGKYHINNHQINDYLPEGIYYLILEYNDSTNKKESKNIYLKR